MQSTREYAFVLSVTRNPIKYVRDELQRLADAEGEKPLARRLDVPFGQLRSMLDGRDPLGSNLFKIAEAIGIQIYVGPSFPIDPSQSNEVPAVLDCEEVRAFQTRISPSGNVAVKIDGTEGSSLMLLTPALSKALADQLTHRALQIEEEG